MFCFTGFAVDWSQKHPEQATATLWSSVQPCSIFTNGSSCYIAGNAHTRCFFQQLEVFLRAAFGDYCTHWRKIQVNADEWRVYLHFESGGVWGEIQRLRMASARVVKRLGQ